MQWSHIHSNRTAGNHREWELLKILRIPVQLSFNLGSRHNRNNSENFQFYKGLNHAERKIERERERESKQNALVPSPRISPLVYTLVNLVAITDGWGGLPSKSAKLWFFPRLCSLFTCPTVRILVPVTASVTPLNFAVAVLFVSATSHVFVAARRLIAVLLPYELRPKMPKASDKRLHATTETLANSRQGAISGL